MPITQSAKKALRQNKRRHARNFSRARAWKEAVKNAKKIKNAESLAAAYQALDKAVKMGVIKKKRGEPQKIPLGEFYRARNAKIRERASAFSRREAINASRSARSER